MSNLLQNLSDCQFARHHCSIRISDILRQLRDDTSPTDADIILVQALLELKDRMTNYDIGPFSIVFRNVNRTGKQNYRLYKDQALLMDADLEGQAVLIRWVSTDPEPLEEFCSLADACARL